MKVITAPEEIKVDKPTIFLAGGITDCPEWQDEMIELLKDNDDGVLLNPRRKNFPIDDPNAAEEQITWEFHALNNCDIFSMWFSAGSSDQPICMLEYGRHVAIRDLKGDLKNVVIGVEPGYRREQDVHIQTELVNKDLAKKISDNLEDHAKNILKALKGGWDSLL